MHSFFNDNLIIECSVSNVVAKSIFCLMGVGNPFLAGEINNEYRTRNNEYRRFIGNRRKQFVILYSVFNIRYSIPFQGNRGSDGLIGDKFFSQQRRHGLSQLLLVDLLIIFDLTEWRYMWTHDGDPGL